MDYSVFRCDRADCIGGGVALFCEEQAKPVRIQLPPQFASCEVICVDFFGTIQYRLACIYRPPSYSVGDSLLLFQLLYWICETTALTVVLLGDFNIPEICWSNSTFPATPICNNFMQFVEENGLCQLVSSPTREQNILDLVLCTDKLCLFDLSIIESFGNSDHSAIEFRLLQRSPQPVVSAIYLFRDFRSF